MKKLLSALSVFLVTFGLTACGGSDGGGGSLNIVSCSLGCAGSGPGGDGQVSCGIQDVFVNGELRVAFNRPIDPSSLSAFSFQVTELGTGKNPAADRFVDPNDPSIVVYRPKLSFDSSGAPVFGLTSGGSYTIKLPGQIEDPGSTYVASVNGSKNRHRMQCTVEASLGILDKKPGAPNATVTVDVVTAYDAGGDPVEFDTDVPAQGAVDVWRFSQIKVVFDDVMNPATLVNPVTGTSDTLQILVDPDGNIADSSDQQLLVGTYTIAVDQSALQTTVVFTSELGFPSAGADPVNKRKVVVHFSPSISDLGGNPVANSDDVAFVPEFVPFDPVTLEEPFDTTISAQLAATGGDWGQAIVGALLPGVAGGSGRLGHLLLEAGQTLTLNTDFEDFSSITDPNVFSPANVLDATFDGTSYSFPPVTDGVFEFASVRLNSGSQLRFEGSQPARLYIRGELLVQGTLSGAGGDSLEHFSTEPEGQEAASGGPSGGSGGAGGRQPSWVNFEGITGVTIPNPLTTPPVLTEIDGQAGMGVEDNLLTPSGTFGAGDGGLAWPQATAANPGFHLPVDPTDISGIELDIIVVCQTKMKGGGGGGGAFGLNGGLPINAPIPGSGFPATQPPTSAGGQASDFGLGIGSSPTAAERLLYPEAGYLHGGAGGGGGGGHLLSTQSDGKVFADCTTTTLGGPATIITYLQHSGAAGGGGGGAIQVQAGSRAVIDGRVDVSGGQGGSKDQLGQAPPGGGGAGGALLLQAKSLIVASAPGRLDISGGKGGFGVAASTGGNGGSGLMRVEVKPPLLTAAAEATKLSPTSADLALVGATLDDVYSYGELATQTAGPGALSGVQSCWLRPEGNFFILDFNEDDGADLGWDMTVIPNPPSLGAQSFRGDNSIFPQSFEDLLGNDLGASPIVVRFQGARSVKSIDSLCDVALGGEDSVIAPGSLTGWVSHPAELNTFFPEPGLRPNMIRFQVLFDRSNPFFSAIAAVDHLYLKVVPD